MRRIGIGLLFAGIALGAASCDSIPGGEEVHVGATALIAPPTPADAAVREYAGLRNVLAFHEGFISGSAPEGDAGFGTLAAMGVKTIISVDGAEPDVAAARAQGIRYIHLPLGYDGISGERTLHLVRATRDARREGAVYIHCHHGKHRSAAAAAVVAVGLGWSEPGAMIDRMRVSGTSEAYTGLYAAAAEAGVIAPDVIEGVHADFPSVSRPSGFVQGMIEIDDVFDRLKLIEKAGWTTPRDHPDLVPAAEAGRLADLFRVLVSGDYAASKPSEFRTGLEESGVLGAALEESLAAGAPDRPGLSARLKLIGASCKDCHARFRD